jgi:hypothetical protein
MYKFIIYIIYRQLERIKNEDPRDGAVSIVCIAIFFHIFLMLSILDYFDLNLLRMTFGEVKNKYYWIPFVVGFMIFVWRYFSKERTEKIIKEFEAKGTKVNWTNTVIVVLITVLPLIIGIQFLNAN